MRFLPRCYPRETVVRMGMPVQRRHLAPECLPVGRRLFLAAAQVLQQQELRGNKIDLRHRGEPGKRNARNPSASQAYISSGAAACCFKISVRPASLPNRVTVLIAPPCNDSRDTTRPNPSCNK